LDSINKNKCYLNYTGINKITDRASPVPTIYNIIKIGIVEKLVQT